MPKDNHAPHIIAGKYKQARLAVPESARPITTRIKQSMFDQLAGMIAGHKVLDLYAGSGSIGIESLSRGASHCTFVEKDDQALELISSNMAKLSIPETSYAIQNQRVNKYIVQSNKDFNLIFADPPFPYATKFRAKDCLARLSDTGALVLRYPIGLQFPIDLKPNLILEQQLGESRVGYFSK